MQHDNKLKPSLHKLKPSLRHGENLRNNDGNCYGFYKNLKIHAFLHLKNMRKKKIRTFLHHKKKYTRILQEQAWLQKYTRILQEQAWLQKYTRILQEQAELHSRRGLIISLIDLRIDV